MVLEKIEDPNPPVQNSVPIAAVNTPKMPSLLIEYDPENRGFRWKFEGNIPTDALIGAMELLKSVLIDNQKALIAQASQMALPKLVIPNGKMPKLRM